MRRMIISAVLILTVVIGGTVQAFCEELVFGVIPRRPAPLTQKMFKPLIASLSQEIGKSIKIVYSKNFDSFLNDIKKEKFIIEFDSKNLPPRSLITEVIAKFSYPVNFDTTKNLRIIFNISEKKETGKNNHLKIALRVLQFISEIS